MTGDLGAELKPARQALVAKDYPNAHCQFSLFAEHNPLAQFTPRLFEQQAWGRPANAAHGTGRAMDGPAALHWYEKAVQSGIVHALCATGDMKTGA